MHSRGDNCLPFRTNRQFTQAPFRRETKPSVTSVLFEGTRLTPRTCAMTSCSGGALGNTHLVGLAHSPAAKSRSMRASERTSPGPGEAAAALPVSLPLNCGRGEVRGTPAPRYRFPRNLRSRVHLRFWWRHTLAPVYVGCWP